MPLNLSRILIGICNNLPERLAEAPEIQIFYFFRSIGNRKQLGININTLSGTEATANLLFDFK